MKYLLHNCYKIPNKSALISDNSPVAPHTGIPQPLIRFMLPVSLHISLVFKDYINIQLKRLPSQSHHVTASHQHRSWAASAPLQACRVTLYEGSRPLDFVSSGSDGPPPCLMAASSGSLSEKYKLSLFIWLDLFQCPYHYDHIDCIYLSNGKPTMETVQKNLKEN